MTDMASPNRPEGHDAAFGHRRVPLDGSQGPHDAPSDSGPGTSVSRLLPVVGHLREAIKTQRALSPDQPGVIRLSCFEAEDMLAAIEAADEYLRRENFALGENVDEALERLEERVSLLYEPRGPQAPQGFAADSDPPYGEDREPERPAYEPIRLPWECVQDASDERLGTARVLDARNELVCTATPRRARLIVSVVNRHASGFDV